MARAASGLLILRSVGGVLGRAAPLVALLALMTAPAAGAAQPRVVDKSQRTVLRSGVLRVQVVAERPGAVRVTARRGRSVVGRRTVRFRRPGARTARIKLSDRGRAAVEKCRAGAIVVTAGGDRAVRRLRTDTGACRPNAPA